MVKQLFTVCIFAIMMAAIFLEGPTAEFLMTIAFQLGVAAIVVGTVTAVLLNLAEPVFD